MGHSFATVTINGNADTTTDFGFVTSGVLNPGTGTPGYWKNHPEAWPADGITVGGVYYEQDKAIALLSKVGKDKTLTMFSSLVSAMLNVLIGNDSSCVASTIAAANAWMVSQSRWQRRGGDRATRGPLANRFTNRWTPTTTD